MSKRATYLRRGRQFRAERRAIGERAPIRGGARSATDALLCWREEGGRFARREATGSFSRALDMETCMTVAAPSPTPTQKVI